jgi:membrane protein
MSNILTKTDHYITKKLWDIDLASSGRLKSLVIKFLRLAYMFVLELSEEELAMRSMSLVYTTLLSIVPLLAVSFSILKAFGVHTKLLIMLYYFLEPLGDQGIDLSLKIIEFVENVKVSVIGSIGIALLIYTVMSQIQKIESALNYIWNVKNTRGFTKRFNNYLSMLLVGPVLVFSIAGVITSITQLGFLQKLAKTQTFGAMFYFAGKFIPYIIVSAAFTFIYITLPNTKVRFKPALWGGVFAGILWVAVGQSFTLLVVSPAKYSAIYSGFATLLLGLIWLYWNFYILLVGARVSFYSQYPMLIAAKKKAFSLSFRHSERLALNIMFLIGHNFHYNKQPWKTESLARRLLIPAEAVENVIEILKQRGMIVSSDYEPPAFFPAKNIETIYVKEIIDSVRLFGEDRYTSKAMNISIPEVDNIIKNIEDVSAGSSGKISVRELILADSHR